MTTNIIPRLYGGVFFTYLLKARKPRKDARSYTHGKSDGLSDPTVFASLIRIFKPNNPTPSSKETFKENTSAYKNCRKKDGAYIPFHNTDDMRSFDECIKNDYITALSRMLTFTERYLETGDGTKKGVYLVETLIEIIAKDNEISDNAEFYVLENGTAITKKEITTSTDFCLQAFLIGVWHYIIQNRPDNLKGRETIEYWQPTAGYRNNLHIWNYAPQTENQAQAAESTERNNLQTETPTPTADDSNFEQEEPIDADDIKERPSPQKRMEGNQMVFIQNGNNNTQIGSVDTLVINHGDKK